MIDKLIDNLKEREIEVCKIDEDSQLVLCHLLNNSLTPYVTWRYDRDGSTFWGNYFIDYEEACEDFYDRIGRR